MEKRFEDYFTSVGMKQPFIDRIEKIMKIVSITLTNSPILDVIIDNTIKKDGEIDYGNLRFYTDKFCITSFDFITEESLAITPLCMKYYSLDVDFKDYDFKKATEKSRLVVTGHYLGTERRTVIRGSGENCDAVFKNI